MTLQCYAQRLLNPFRGTMQVIRHASAEAVSLDGLNWDIYVANDSLLDGLANSARVQVSDIRFGHWSEAGGLKRGPLYPSQDFRRMEAMGAVVYAHLTRVHANVPFPLRDIHECWLLDADGMPLALLHSALEANPEPGPVKAAWSTGLAARERFNPVPEWLPGEAARRLDAYVNGLAGPAPATRWFRREPDGAGTAPDGTTLPATAFPPLLLRESGHDAAMARLVEAYLDWQAAWLLCLPLAPEDRCRLEARARVQAGLVEALHRLYPEIIEPAALNAARVEARLLDSQAARATSEADAAASTFYIELNPQGGGYT
jgi:hypothetical protein